MSLRISILCGIVLGVIALLNIPPPTSKRAPVSFGGDVHPIASISPADTLYGDLAFLKEALKDKRIVALGEATHYDGSAFLAKTRLVQFLHRELGYHVLAFEAGRYDMWRLDQDPSLPPEQGLYLFWSQSDQVRALWNYVHSHRLSVAGFDAQHTGALSDTLRRDLLFDYLQRFEPDAPARWSRYHQAALRLRWYLHPNGMDREKLAPILSEIDSIRCFLGQCPDSREKSVWHSFVSDLRSWWECANTYPPGDSTRFALRDSIMAKNIIALASAPEYRDKKIILWMANVHAFYDNQQVPKHSFLNTGQRIKEHFGETLYTIVFSSYCRSDSDRMAYDLARFNSLEYALHANRERYLYVDHIAKEENTVVSRVNQGSSWLLDLGAMTDGIFFIDTMYNRTYSTHH